MIQDAGLKIGNRIPARQPFAWSININATSANSTSALVGIIMEADCLIMLRPNSSAPPVVSCTVFNTPADLPGFKGYAGTLQLIECASNQSRSLILPNRLIQLIRFFPMAGLVTSRLVGWRIFQSFPVCIATRRARLGKIGLIKELLARNAAHIFPNLYHT